MKWANEPMGERRSFRRRLRLRLMETDVNRRSGKSHWDCAQGGPGPRLDRIWSAAPQRLNDRTNKDERSLMKLSFFSCATALIATSLYAAAAPKDDVINAAKKLGEQPNYSWKTTVVVPENAQFRPGPSEGQT